MFKKMIIKENLTRTYVTKSLCLLNATTFWELQGLVQIEFYHEQIQSFSIGSGHLQIFCSMTR